MTQTYETHEGIVVPESVLVKVERADKYGRVPGLEDEELADPDELERQAFRRDWAPILALPKPVRECSIRPSIFPRNISSTETGVATRRLILFADRSSMSVIPPYITVIIIINITM